jgi:lysophospholipase L1-like esterase
MPIFKFRRLAALALLAVVALHDRPALAQLSLAPAEATTDMTISWEVRNRFRLFRDEKDFNRHVAATSGRSILAAEQALAQETEGRGWARDMVTRLCVDGAGRIVDTCMRDGARESYLDPVDHRVRVRLTGTVPAEANCDWTFDSHEGAPQAITASCREEVNLRARYGKTTSVTVDITPQGGAPRRATAEIEVRDLLIAGIGDSIAAGEGDPDRPVALADDGFCFRNFISTGRSEYFRPGRVGFDGDKACDGARDAATNMADWAKLSARWLSAACHRSLYGYQLRAALGLAIDNPHIAVTFLPLACTGATIDTGLFGPQRARELNCGGGADTTCPTSMPGQLGQLRDILARAKRVQPNRALDLVFLTIGANDIYFSGLVGDVIIDSTADRLLAKRGGVISSVEDAQAQLQGTLPANFVKLRATLKQLLGGRLDKVVFTSYANPALAAEGGACAGGRDGFDVHPAFSADGARMRRVSQFVQNRFLPAIKALATCTGGVVCGPGDSMAFADSHQAAFAQHGLCARADTDPQFDRQCFSTDGKSFADNPVDGATDPMACDMQASEFRAYAPRARWIRTANDSYFTAMTFPEGVSSSMQPSDLHDATWGILSAVYGGAIHPTAEGYAAMADAAFATARAALRLGPAVEGIEVAPLGPPGPVAPTQSEAR